MQLDRLQVELRPRSPWEAMELGSALLRRHAGTVWRAWLLASVLPLLLFNALGVALGKVWLAGLAMWWLKPAFDRVVLFVLSRAVFGQPASVADSAMAPLRFGRGALAGDLTWRRISLSRALFLPASLLEGLQGAPLRARRRVLAMHGGQAIVGLTLLCLLFEVVLSFATVMFLPGFVPTEYLSESARAIWETLFQAPPPGALVVMNLLAWGATTVVEPFYVAAGFGVYLNRRTQLEGWDIEIAFRRMRARLRAAAAGAMLVLLCIGLAPPARAAQEAGGAAPAPGASQPNQPPAQALDTRKVFGAQAADAASFERTVQKALQDPLLAPKRKQTYWVPKKRPDAKKPGRGLEFPLLGALAGLFSEGLLWLLLGVAVLLVLWTLPRWWPDLWRPLPRAPAPAPVQEAAAPHHEALPDDIAAAARKLWQEGRPRAALALLYRASVEAMAARIDAVLPPGATEAQCLRASRRLADAEDRSAFAEVVRTWQLAAYAQRLPDAEGFERVLSRGGQRFGWAS